MALLISGCAAPWSAGAPSAREMAVEWARSVVIDPQPSLPWVLAQPIAARQLIVWVAAIPGVTSKVLPWARAIPLKPPAVSAPWVISHRADARARLVVAPGADRWTGIVVRAPWVISRRADAATAVASNAAPVARDHLRHFPWGDQIARDTDAWLPWGQGRQISQGPIIIIPAPDPDEPDPSTAVIPVLEFYYVINSVTLVRADSGDEIPCRDLRVGISRDTPHWSWSASIPGAARALLARDPYPVELIATLNGQALRLVVERTQRDRRVASDWIRASGRSRSAWLSAPYVSSVARGNASPANAQQLAGEALTINGVPIGWTLDWHVPDWLVPAGAWSHSGTYMEAVVRIAEAAGGYVQAHPSDQVLRVLPIYPALPWELSSSIPNVVLPEDVVEVEGVELSDSPEYNAVYVEGLAGGGRRDRILRTGSLGDLMAPQVVDALATAVEMTRARGAAVLAAGGLQERVQIRMPVLSYTGLILPGNVVDYTAEGVTRRGISRSLDVEWSSPELWQTIEVEVRV